MNPLGTPAKAGRNSPDTTPDFPFCRHTHPIEARAAFAESGWPFEEYCRFTFARYPWRRMISPYRSIRRPRPSFRPSFAEWPRRTRATPRFANNVRALIFVRPTIMKAFAFGHGPLARRSRRACSGRARQVESPPKTAKRAAIWGRDLSRSLS